MSVATISAHGTLVLGGADLRNFETELATLKSPGLQVVLDLLGVKDLDSSGVGTIVAAGVGVQKGGGKLVIAATGYVAEKWDMLLLSSVFPTYPDLSAALDSFAK